MAKALRFLALAIVVFFFPSAFCEEKFDKLEVEGSVYCDPCHVGYHTSLSKNIPDALVRLECKNMIDGKLTYSIEGKTNKDGKYWLQVIGDHDKDICQVSAISSPMPNCNEIMDTKLEKARVECSTNTGMSDPVRYANPLAFVSLEPAPECEQVLGESGHEGLATHDY